MTQYIYDTSVDEEKALDKQLAIANGQLLSANQPVIDKQELFRRMIFNQLQPLSNQILLEEASPMVQAYMKALPADRPAMVAHFIVAPSKGP